MASKTPVNVGKNPNGNRTNIKSKEKSEVYAKEIERLKDENKKLFNENLAFKTTFNIREILKVLSNTGVTEYDTIEIAKEALLEALKVADQKHSAEMEDIKRKYEKEIANLNQTQHGENQLSQKLMLKESKGSAPNDKPANDNKELQKLKVENDQLRNRLSQKEAEVAELNNNITRLKESKGSAPNDKPANDNKELQKLKVENDQLKNRLSQKETEVAELNNNITRLKESKGPAPNDKPANDNKELQKLKVENDQLKNRLSQKEIELAELNNNISRLKESKGSAPSNKPANDNKELQKLKVENDQLKNRLSEMAGAQMTFNNPNIADLSDEFRPTKLSEDYSQLYDNQWTDAFEEHDGRKEEDIIQMLRTSLLGCYEFCEQLCTQFTDQLKNATLALPNAEPRTQDIPIVYKKQLQDVKKSFGAFLRNDVKESYWRKWNTVENGRKTKNYVDACVEICWLMVIQEPPVVMEAQASKDGVFDSEIFKTYTKTGNKVDFVVWPALRLHKGGPLLTKGVAQGKN